MRLSRAADRMLTECTFTCCWLCETRSRGQVSPSASASASTRSPTSRVATRRLTTKEPTPAGALPNRIDAPVRQPLVDECSLFICCSDTS